MYEFWSSLLIPEELQAKFKAKAEKELLKQKEQESQLLAVKVTPKRLSEEVRDESPGVDIPFRLHHNLPDQNFSRSPSLTRLRYESKPGEEK